MRFRQRTLLGVIPRTNGNWRVCPAWGCGRPPIRPICVPGDAWMANANWDPARCRWVPYPSPAVAASSPVPVGFPTNQLFMAPDGSQWAYSTAQGKWVNVGTPYDLSQASNPPPASTSTPPAVAPAPVSVSVTAAPPATASPYQSVLDFATQSSLISGVPNWLVGVGVLLGFKVVEGMSGRRAR